MRCGAGRSALNFWDQYRTHFVMQILNIYTASITEYRGHDRMRRGGADLRGGTPLVSYNHVIDPHFVTFCSSLYTQSATLALTLTLSS